MLKIYIFCNILTSNQLILKNKNENDLLIVKLTNHLMTLLRLCIFGCRESWIQLNASDEDCRFSSHGHALDLNTQTLFPCSRSLPNALDLIPML